jgi:hypothetical protein
VCENGRELPRGPRRWILYEANVTDVISGEFNQDGVSFAASIPLDFQCITLDQLPPGSEGQRLRDLGVGFQASAAYCDEFRPRCEQSESGSNTCYWDGWLLDLGEESSQVLRSEPQQPNLTLIDRFLEVQEFELFEFLGDLPQDLQELLPRWEDGTFAIAEKGEAWNSTGVISAIGVSCDI